MTVCPLPDQPTSLLPSLDVRPRWQEQAACRGANTDLFYCQGQGDARTQTRLAKEVCAQCPVIEECLAYAQRQPGAEKFGVWGGMTERERRNERRAQRRALGLAPWRAEPRPIPHGTESGYSSPNYKCRCDPCRQAHARHTAGRMASKAE